MGGRFMRTISSKSRLGSNKCAIPKVFSQNEHPHGQEERRHPTLAKKAAEKLPKNYSGKHAFFLQLLCGFLILDVSKYCNTSNI
jgi:hypothetical protein